MEAVQLALDLAKLADRFRGLSAPPPSPNGVNGEVSPSPNGSNGESSPSPNGVNGAHNEDGRDSRGRFAMGNKGGPGNPFARRVAKLRQLVLETVQEGGLRAIVQRLVDAAKTGNIPAARLVLAYMVGKPQDAVDPDRVDVDGWKLLLEMGIMPQQFQKLLHLMPANLACELTEIAWPCITAAAAQPALRKAEAVAPTNNGEQTPPPAPAALPVKQAAPARRDRKKRRKAA